MAQIIISLSLGDNISNVEYCEGEGAWCSEVDDPNQQLLQGGRCLVFSIIGVFVGLPLALPASFNVIGSCFPGGQEAAEAGPEITARRTTIKIASAQSPEETEDDTHSGLIEP